jgi:hypothetical protein
MHPDRRLLVHVEPKRETCGREGHHHHGEESWAIGWIGLSILYSHGENSCTCAHWRTAWPPSWPASSTVGFKPCSIAWAAAASPIGPAPMIATFLPASAYLHLPVHSAGRGRRAAAMRDHQSATGPERDASRHDGESGRPTGRGLRTAGSIQRDPDAPRAGSGKLVSRHWSREAGQELP